MILNTLAWHNAIPLHLVSPTASKIAILLFRRWDSKGDASPITQRRIAEICAMSERTVRRAVTELRDLGFLTWYKVQNKRTGYVRTFYEPCLPEQTPTDSEPKPAADEPKPAVDEPKPAETCDRPQVAVSTYTTNPTLYVCKSSRDLDTKTPPKIKRLQGWFLAVGFATMRSDLRHLLDVPDDYIKQRLRDDGDRWFANRFAVQHVVGFIADDYAEERARIDSKRFVPKHTRTRAKSEPPCETRQDLPRTRKKVRWVPRQHCETKPTPKPKVTRAPKSESVLNALRCVLLGDFDKAKKTLQNAETRTTPKEGTCTNP